MKEIFSFFTFQFNSTLNYINFYFAKKKADKLHALTGKRYHVIPTGKYRLSVVDNNYIDLFNRIAKKKGRKQISIMDLIQMSYYTTSVQGLMRK
jgi:hypothetical protein